MKAAVPLGLALLVSVILNVVLLRREPPAAPHRPGPASAAASLPTPVEDDADKILLREEVRILRNKLAVARTRLELNENVLGFPAGETGDDPETRAYTALHEQLATFIEEREVDTRDEQGRPVRATRQVLTPQNRSAALRAIEAYLGLDGSGLLTFHDQAEAALGEYHRILDAFNREHAAAAKAGENDEFFEDSARRRQEVLDRMSRKQEEWTSVHVRPIQDFLERRDGVRSSILSHNLPGLLFLLGSPDER
jgi:hypothetical protein